ncbi:hypothetical protein BT63DRAFT_424375 [Microthyrium microscopicum]|uniref:Uncharacterized protein n=1 Tax=Microthyrium microscopicum TaxID=703497 RepID=A0A6A6UE40_9PEZI|nr:hypothetical protein BT63DRAFT_424375 [Microthyrium microscopicum]
MDSKFNNKINPDLPSRPLLKKRRPTAHPLHLLLRKLNIFFLFNVFILCTIIFASPVTLFPGKAITKDYDYYNTYEYPWMVQLPIWEIIAARPSMPSYIPYIMLIVSIGNSRIRW